MELGDGTLYLLIRGIQLQSGMTGCFDSSASQTGVIHQRAHSHPATPLLTMSGTRHRRAIFQHDKIAASYTVLSAYWKDSSSAAHTDFDIGPHSFPGWLPNPTSHPIMKKTVYWFPCQPTPGSKLQSFLNTCSSNWPPTYLNFLVPSGTCSGRLQPPRPVKSLFASTRVVRNKFHAAQQELEKSPVYTVTRWVLVI